VSKGPKRRRFLVKHWFQIRYILLLAGGAAAGGVAYAMFLQSVLRQRMEQVVASGDNLSSGVGLWLSLYPLVAVATLVLAALGTLLLFVLFRVFVSRVSLASSRLERYYRVLAEGGDPAAHEGNEVLPEFDSLAERTAELVSGCQLKWSAIAVKAGAVRAAAGAIGGESDPGRRLLALRECERLAASLGESCRPRRQGGE
jgi:hypothetical protein